MTAVVVLGAFSLGACLGSFANVCVWRIPRPGLSPASPPRSLCPRCGFLLPWHNNIPLLSWFFLGGDCARCGGPISVRYTVVEALTAAGVAFLGWKLLGVEFLPGEFVLWTALFTCLVVAAFVDLELMILPDEVVLPSLAAVPWLLLFFPSGFGPGEDILSGRIVEEWNALTGGGLGLGGYAAKAAAAAAGAAGGVLVGERFRRKALSEPQERSFVEILAFYLVGAWIGSAAWKLIGDPETLIAGPGRVFFSSAAGAGTGAAIIWLIRVLGRYAFAQEAMGFGDVKLMAVLGALTGVGGSFWTVILACVLGSVVGILRFAVTRERQLPFGPFLIVGSLVVLFGRTHLSAFLKWYGTVLAGS